MYMYLSQSSKLSLPPPYPVVTISLFSIPVPLFCLVDKFIYYKTLRGKYRQNTLT